MNKEILEFMKYHNFMESIKANKDIKDLPRYIREHVLLVIEKKQDQIIKTALELLEVKYGRSRTEKIKEFVKDILKFKEDQYKEDGKLIIAMKDIRQIEKELEITQDEWFAAWMLGSMSKRKQIDCHELQALRNVVKKGRDTVFEEFEEKFQEV